MAEAPPPDDTKIPAVAPTNPPPGEAGQAGSPAKAAADKQQSGVPGEPLKGEVSRADAAGAGASAAPVGSPRQEPAAPKPANPEAAVTATTSETSSATGQATAPSPATPAAASAAQAATGGTPATRPTVAAKPGEAGQAVPPARAAAQARPAAPAAKPAGAAPAAEHPPKAAAPAGPPDPPPPPTATPPAFIAGLKGILPEDALRLSFWVGDWTIIIPAAHVLDVARYLRDAPDALFDLCSDVTATDWPLRPERFDVIYCLYSIRHRHRVRVKAKARETEPVASVTPVWPAANWLEREVYDMFGVNFVGHPDRRRILMPDDWQGFPQRKDYPLEGPGELLMENPLDWLKLRQAREEAQIE
jgi:NADH-quinone oxidoreductase subunit C